MKDAIKFDHQRRGDGGLYDLHRDVLRAAVHTLASPQPAESHIERANRIVDSWPEWKRNYALTKHDVKP